MGGELHCGTWDDLLLSLLAAARTQPLLPLPGRSQGRREPRGPRAELGRGSCGRQPVSITHAAAGRAAPCGTLLSTSRDPAASVCGCGGACFHAPGSRSSRCCFILFRQALGRRSHAAATARTGWGRSGGGCCAASRVTYACAPPPTAAQPATPTTSLWRLSAAGCPVN